MQPLICDAVPASFFSVEVFVGLIFLLTVVLVLSGAVIAVHSTRLVRAVAGLALSFTGLAGVYYFLLSPFVAMMQLIVYVGAVSILIAFGIMMAKPESEDLPGVSKASPFVGPVGVSVAGILFSALVILATVTPWQRFPQSGKGDIASIGAELLTTHSMVFELISVVLLMAIIGALVLAQRGRR